MEQEPILPTPTEAPAQANASVTAPEASRSQTPEAVAAGAEHASQGAGPVALPQVSPVSPVATVPVGDDQQAQGASSSSPAVADDVDVIEKEWVDKAKKIVATTKDNPYQQEKEVSKLQADYLMKRYGKQVKLVE